MYCKYKATYSFKMTPGMAEFVERMNFRAAQIGMKSSTFVNPDGGEGFGFNSTTCMDLLRLGSYVYHAYPYIMDVMTTRFGAKFHIYGPHDRDVTLEYDYQQDFDRAYERVHGDRHNPHVIFGGKGGGWGVGEHKIFAYLAYCRVSGRNVLAVAANVTADRSVGRDYRKNAIIEILDICKRKLDGGDTSGATLTYADYGAAMLLPDMPSVLMKQRPIELLFDQKSDAPFNPASTTKVLTVITAWDICAGNQEMYEISEDDISNDSTYWAFPGDIESVETGLYPILITSNGTNTMALARHCGEKILEEKRRHGILAPSGAAVTL